MSYRCGFFLHGVKCSGQLLALRGWCFLLHIPAPKAGKWVPRPTDGGTTSMDDDMTRRLVKGLLTLALTTLATWLANYLTDRILGPELLDEG